MKNTIVIAFGRMNPP
jgi:nicotinic acid mononucleotide adenylyltransferase